ncbi:MAG: cupin domain-containing protein [Micromonosporaceae bacterium]|nr:cupin domain-containing protein [Micromonosporaceae bacterium]
MGASDVPPIGARIRAQRLRRGVTVRGLARDVGVSPSLISQIETDRKSPSVSTLYAITTALGISVEELFVPNGDGRPQAGSPPGPAPPGARGAGRAGPVAGPGQRRVVTFDSGVTWELLGQVPRAQLEFLLITYPPGGSSARSGLLMRHSGTECGYLLRGELVLTLGFDEYRLTAGDSVSFDSATPHAYRNDGTEPAVGVWFVLERPPGSAGTPL